MGRTVKTKLMGICLPVLLVLCLCSACVFAPDLNLDTETNDKGETNVNLTQRQMEILEKEGLSTDYHALLTSQKRDIMAIEEMLCYLEETYGKPAEYVSFTQGSKINPEALRARLGDVVVTLERTQQDGQYIYQDDYAAVLAKPDYEAQLAEFFRAQNLEVLVFSNIVMKDTQVEQLLGKVSGSAFVFINKELSHQELAALTEAYAQWYAPQLQGRSNTTRMYATSQALFAELTEENYLDRQQEVPEAQKVMCHLYPDGSFKID